MIIPIFKLEFDEEFIATFKDKAVEILTSNRPLAENKYVAEFENKFASLVGAKHAVAVTNGTVALELALKVLQVKNKVVLIPSNTFFATSVAVTNAGGRIDLVDADPDNFSLSPEDLEKKINQYQKNGDPVGAVIVVHIGGIISKHIRKLKKICDDYGIPLVEDAAHAQCSQFDGLRAGTIGTIGCFSFFPTKVMTSGEGGILTLNNEKMAEMIRSLKNFGRDNDDQNICVNPDGNNYKVTELTGLLGSMECDRVLKRIGIRNDLVTIYKDRLQGSGYTPVLQEGGLCSYYKMILKTSIDREWLKKFCKNHGITLTGEVYKIPVHQQPLYKKEFRSVKLPITDDIAAHHICPPLYPELSSKEINYICDILLKAEAEYEK